MKLIVAIIQPTKLNAVKDALAKAGIERLTATDGQGYGRQKGQSLFYRGNEYQIDLLRKVVLEVTVNDDFVERTIETITAIARTGPEGEIGDGKIFIMPVDGVIRISDKVRGPEAV